MMLLGKRKQLINLTLQWGSFYGHQIADFVGIYILDSLGRFLDLRKVRIYSNWSELIAIDP